MKMSKNKQYLPNQKRNLNLAKKITNYKNMLN